MKNRNTILAASALALSACAQPISQSEWNETVAALQVGLPLLEASLANTHDGSLPAVRKAETQLNTDVAALGGAPAPTSAQAVLTDLQALNGALLTSTESPAHQAEVGALLAGAEKLLALTQPAAVTASAAHAELEQPAGVLYQAKPTRAD